MLKTTSILYHKYNYLSILKTGICRLSSP